MATTGTWVPFGNRYAFEDFDNQEFANLVLALFDENEDENLLMISAEIYGEEITFTRDDVYEFGPNQGWEDILDRLYEEYGIGDDETLTGIVTSGYFTMVG